jgi:AAA+ ATPase superfamily predicted ATPase
MTADQRFVNRERELQALERFWQLPRAQCIPVTGRRRVGKTFLIEQFAAGRRHVYYRCQLRAESEQLRLLGEALVRFQSRAWGMLTSDRYETANLCA